MRAQKVICGILAVALVAGGCKKRPRDLTTDLHRAAGSGNISQVQALIARGSNVSARDDKGRTPLLLAAESGHREVVEVLVRCGAQINAEDASGQTPSDVAVAKNHRTVVEYLVSKGAVSTLRTAAYLGDVDRVKSLIEGGADVNAGAGIVWTALHYAACYDQRTAAETLIAGGARLDSPDRDGSTPLHVAAGDGHLDMVRLLLTKGASINAADRNGETPLHLALLKNRVDVAELLIASGADANAKSHLVGGIPFCYAAEQGLVSIVKLLIARGTDIKMHGGEALHAAAANDRREMVLLLLENGIDVNSPGEFGWTALHAAAAEGHAEMVKLLLARGADANGKGAEYEDSAAPLTPLHWAAARADKTIVELLLAYGADVNIAGLSGRKPLHDLLRPNWDRSNVWALITYFGIEDLARQEDSRDPLRAAWPQEREQRMQILGLFVAHGADVNAVDNCGWTPLHVAAEEGWQDAAEVLLDKGASLNARTTGPRSRRWHDSAPTGQTPLLLALQGGYVNVAQLLVERGADINLADSTGCTPLVCALLMAEERNPSSPAHSLTASEHHIPWTTLYPLLCKAGREMVERLVSRGADVNPMDEEGQTPLHRAAQRGDEGLAKLLILHGARVNAADKAGATPLHCAVRISKDVVALLLAHGADVNLADQRGDTPLHTAALRGHREIVELLLARNPDLNVKNSRGCTPSDEAKRQRHADIVQLLTAKAASSDASGQGDATRK